MVINMNKYLFDKNQIVTDINLVTIMAPDVEPTLNHPDRPNHGFAYAISSTVEYIFDDGTRLMCSPRNLIYLPEHRSYYIKKHESGYTACINFKLLNDTEIYDPFMLEVRDSSQIEQYYASAFAARTRGLRGSLSVCFSALYAIMSIAESGLSLSYVSPEQSDKLERIMAYIGNNLTDSRLTVESLASLAGMTTVWFRKLFLAKYGIQPSKYIKSRRVEAAKDLLISTGLSVGEISLRAGFSDSAYFCREFRRVVGMTPGRYRGEYRM